MLVHATCAPNAIIDRQFDSLEFTNLPCSVRQSLTKVKLKLIETETTLAGAAGEGWARGGGQCKTIGGLIGTLGLILGFSQWVELLSSLTKFFVVCC